MKQDIKLIALDLDGTLYHTDGTISEKNRAVLKQAIDRGVTVVISTGRPYVGLSVSDLKEIGIDYAITSNGAGIYRISDKLCLFEDAIPADAGAALLAKLYQYPIHLDAFINGDAYTQTSTRPFIDKLNISESLRTYIRDTRIVVDDLAALVADQQLGIQKLTLNFVPDENGHLTAREDVIAFLSQHPEYHFVSGGFCNIEVNKAGVSKADGLRFLCKTLHIPLARTMACGDSENDLAIVSAAGIGVAMANAEEILLKSADFISRSNNEDGVAYAIEELVL